MNLGINIGPRQRWLRVAAGAAIVVAAFTLRLGPVQSLLLALVGAGSIASGASGF